MNEIEVAPATAAAAAAPEVAVVRISLSGRIPELVEFFPKRLQNCARLLFHSIKTISKLMMITESSIQDGLSIAAVV